MELLNEYSKILKEFEEYRQEKFLNGYFEQSLSLPEVKIPDNMGKQATEKFKEAYKELEQKTNGEDIKNVSNPFLSESDEVDFQKFLKKFKVQKMKEFNDIKLGDDISIKDLLKNELDMSTLWNLDSLKKTMQISGNISKFLSNTPKPEGWETVRNKVSAPSMSSWLNNGPTAEGYGESTSIVDTVINSLPSELGSLKEKFSDGIKNIKDKIDDIWENKINLKEKWENFKSEVKSKISSFFTEK